MRSTRISRGSGSNGSSRCGGSPIISTLRARCEARGAGLVYPSFESRAEIARLVAQHRRCAWPHDPDGAPLYPGTQEADARSARAASRRAILCAAARHERRDARTGALTWVEIGADPKQDHETLMARAEKWGDVVLARKDTPTSYHLSVVVDDALQGVTHVVRGQDL
jgi:glutamyl-Q tRNA(Asp) synthetase